MRRTTQQNNSLFFSISTILLFTLLLLPDPSGAHSLFIQSSRYQVAEGKQSPLFFCYGHHIPVDDGGRAKKLKSVRVRVPGGEIREIDIRNETCLHSYMVAYDKPGTYALSAETNPGYYTVYIDENGRQRHTIKPKSAIIDKAREVQKSLYSTQYTKTYVVCKTPSPEFPARLCHTLELVPTKDISTLKAGETPTLRFYYRRQKKVLDSMWCVWNIKTLKVWRT